MSYGGGFEDCYSGKALIITYSECVFVALGIQHAKRMRCVILSSVTCMTLKHFSTYKAHDLLKKKTGVSTVMRYKVRKAMRQNCPYLKSTLTFRK